MRRATPIPHNALRNISLSMSKVWLTINKAYSSATHCYG
jgi:hypothetical protein